MKGLYLLCLYFFYLTGFSQNQFIQNDTTNIQLLIEKKKQYHQITKGVYDGYRVKIYFDASREKMEKVKEQFQIKYPEIPIYS
ncbi:MAG: hypothetical protein N2203_07910, partial [Bacteroidia bacterium]|nr:hypothetical protein [Bacteroidia bacterium]